MKQCRPKRKRFSLTESRQVKKLLDLYNRYPLKEFHMGMNVELEHHNITCGSPLQTGKIVMAHMPETKHYYPKLLKYVEGA